MPIYSVISAEELEVLTSGLEILERLRSDEVLKNLFLYGLTNERLLIEAAKAAVAESNDLDAEIDITQLAIAMPLHSSTISSLFGSGLKLEREEFSYLGAGAEGARTESFVFAHYHPKATIRSFSVLAISEDNNWLDDFLTQHKANTLETDRNQPATLPKNKVNSQVKSVREVVEGLLDR
jgi:hypothetical protein